MNGIIMTAGKTSGRGLLNHDIRAKLQLDYVPRFAIPSPMKQDRAMWAMC